MSQTAIRLDRRFQERNLAFVDIVRDVLGGPRDAGGPAWLLDPPVAVREEFLRRHTGEFTETDRVFVARGRVVVDALLDARGQRIPELSCEPREAYLFFIDHDPRANWAHACTYILVLADASEARAAHRFPPSEAVQLHAIEPPSGRV
ncbi:MAG: hypothetical protein HY720_21650 [Planctomycetes bacterium]|nr:hypothetical protein [Planctomycetota bacterium]